MLISSSSTALPLYSKTSATIPPQKFYFPIFLLYFLIFLTFFLPNLRISTIFVKEAKLLVISKKKRRRRLPPPTTAFLYAKIVRFYSRSIDLNTTLNSICSTYAHATPTHHAMKKFYTHACIHIHTLHLFYNQQIKKQNKTKLNTKMINLSIFIFIWRSRSWGRRGAWARTSPYTSVKPGRRSPYNSA